MVFGTFTGQKPDEQYDERAAPASVDDSLVVIRAIPPDNTEQMFKVILQKGKPCHKSL